ncbi:hypothetical protein N658DRAFT_445927, partial [Parathielavia hyrcaniae]
MAAEGTTQALVAAFLFGLVLNAAAAALVLYLRGCGLASLLRDSQRLVLVLFLLSAALWAQLDFITILLDVSTSPTPCQIGIIFSTVFDQFARFSIEQFLIWALNASNGAKSSIIQLIPQLLVVARFLAGAVLIGFTRPQTDTFCVTTTSAPPLGVLVASLDVVIILLLVLRAYFAGRLAKDDGGGRGNDADRARALMLVVLGLAFWTGTSVPLLLGIRSLPFATRTALPAGGLLAAIASVAGSAGSLLRPRTTDSRPPEAPSPRRINISRNISTSDSDAPPSRYEDLKDAAIRSSTTFVNPREVPRIKDETGVGFPFRTERALQEESAIPFRTITAPASNVAWKLDKTASQKRGLLSFPKGKPAISHPVLQDNSGRNPLDRIAVMDLQAAAIADKDRRARMKEDESVSIGRPAAPLMGMTQEEALKRGVSLKRKEVASVSNKASGFPGALRPEVAALTTSAQLSPGGEETRRRSPRHSLQGESVPAQRPSPVPAVETVKPRSESPQDRPLTILQPLLGPSIRPSRMLPPLPKSPPPESTKTPLQRRPTIGLPSNPRARGLETAEEAGPQHRTVLFVNSIEYNDPLAVEAIIQDAGNAVAKPVPVVLAPDTPGTSNSVVNRPRPIPRKASDPPVQANPALTHTRSKSSGSLMGLKSLLASSAGSPTQLPPLPSLPRSATMLSRPQPNQTKSMTFEEKVTLLFPSPLSGKIIKRRSSVPEIPRIPVSYLDMESTPREPFHNGDSKRTTETSLRTESLLEDDGIPRLPGRIAGDATGEAGSSWHRAFGDAKDYAKHHNTPAVGQASGTRGLSPVFPLVPRVSAWTETTYDRSEDEATNWSSVNSLELAISVPVMQLGVPSSTHMHAPRASELSFADDHTRETLPIMLDTSTMQHADLPRSLVSEAKAVAAPELPTWHRRVGDECPTFSDRKEKTKSRRVCPPTPLSLNSISPKMILAAIQAEPSPLESPGQAIQQIQAQLKNLDELDQATPQSAARRLVLLADLEREMGQQAEHWHEIKHDMGRDSMSSMQTTSPAARPSRHESVASVANVARESIRLSIEAERRVSPLSRSQNNGTLETPNVAARNAGSPKMNKWQKRLTEAQMDYMDARLLRGSNVAFMQLSRAQLASPTPLDSDDEAPSFSGEDVPDDVEAEQRSEAVLTHSSLWTMPSKEPVLPTGFLWVFVSKPPQEIEVPLPGLSVRPAQRKEQAPLPIESSQLWRKPYSIANRATSGLWRPVWASAAPPAEPVVRASPKPDPGPQKRPRPLTQRPPRRNKRMTLLPDILESPEPLPDKRGTLGIFQFPWGEVSDTARIEPRTSIYRAMPGTMTSGGPSFGLPTGAGFKQVETTDYSSSFFDDYEDDDQDLDSDEEDSDDGFDETTLWEIASLLKTDAVPSRDSLLPPPPPPSSSVMDDYGDELTSEDEEGQSPWEQSIIIGLAEPQEWVLEEQRDSETIESSTLLLLEDALEFKAQPELADGVGRPVITPVSEATPAPEVSQEVQTADPAPWLGSSGLWYPPAQADKPAAPGGLFVPRFSRSEYRGASTGEPTATYISRKPRPVEQKPLDRLTSTWLWEPAKVAKKSQRNWILGDPAPQLRSTGLCSRQRPRASPKDWKSALDAAIAASNPHFKLFRSTATPAQWKAALDEAISRSSRRVPAFHSAVCHPVFAASSLVTRSEWFYSAATGYTHDASVVHHPVFFGSGAKTFAPEEAVHPAFFSVDTAKDIHERRCSEQQHQQSSNSRSRSRNSSQSGSWQKDEVRAQNQIPQALEQQEPPRHNTSTIQAQTQAVEHERQFAERAAAQEETTTTTTTTAAAAAAEPAEMEVEVDALMMMPAGAATVQDLQRQLSVRIRESLVFAGTSTGRSQVSSFASVSSSPVSSSAVGSGSKPESVHLNVVRSVGSVVDTASQVGSCGQSPLLWTVIPARPRRAAPVVASAAGLWSARSASLAAPSWIATTGEEDAVATSRRARSRRVVQTKQRRQEMLGQTGAGEGAVKGFVDLGGMGLWEDGVGGGRDR